VSLEDRVENYIQENSAEGRALNLSLAKMADQIGCSVATVHRTVQKLEREGLIKIERHRARNKADKIIFVGKNLDDVSSLMSELVEKSNSFNSLVQNLVTKLSNKEIKIRELEEKLQSYENRQIIDEVKVSDNVTAVFYRN
jgi:DNA-binding transcriptional regulator YhcF (GntR family)